MCEQPGGGPDNRAGLFSLAYSFFPSVVTPIDAQYSAHRSSEILPSANPNLMAIRLRARRNIDFFISFPLYQYSR